VEAEAEDLVVHVQPTREEARVDRLGPLDDEGEEVPYAPPSMDLLDPADSARPFDPEEIEENKQVLLDKLETYRIRITALNAIVGPTVTLYELTPAPGIKISRITALEDDLAMALAARGIRMIAPIPGKSAIGVEIPNRHRQMVRIRDVIATEKFKTAKMELPFPIGKSIEGETYVEDLSRMPHVLIAGATGSGKSVGLNTLIAGLLYRCHPANLKFVFIDPKKIELTPYGRLREHFIALPENYDEPVVTDFSMALGVLKSCEREMERRYDLLSKAQVRGIKDYNKKLAVGDLDTDRGHRHLPYVVVVVDELADLMMTAGKEIEGPIARLAQMARAVGIHLVLATQRPSVDVITGLIKANFPSRIAYQVASRIDSRTIIDQGGAEQLVGNGDLLYMNGSRMVRLQGPYVAMEEIERLVDAIADQDGPGPYRLPSFEDEADDPLLAPDEADRDDLFETAARVIVTHQQGSVSLLQRKLGIGYGRAARIVDQLERAGIVGRAEGAQKARAVLIQTESQLDSFFSKGEWEE
jgi:DNA segregation ATPase FtsK/SpoIIIE, S-DNA-T family